MAWDLLKKNKTMDFGAIGNSLGSNTWVLIRSKPTISCPVYTGLKEREETTIKIHLG